MVFARKTRSDGEAQRPRHGGETGVRSLGKIIDPFAQDREFPDPAALAEQVVFKLWSDGAVKGRAIEQARRESDDKLRLDQALTRLRLADPEPVAAALAEEIDAPLAQERDYPRSCVMSDALPGRFVREALALPLADDGETLVLAMADPLDDYALRAIAMKTRRRLAVKVACAKRLEAEIDRLYRGDSRREAPKALPAPRSADMRAEPRRPAERPAPRPQPEADEAPRRRAAEPEEQAPRDRSPVASVTPRFLKRRSAEPAPPQRAERPAPDHRRRADQEEPRAARDDRGVRETPEDVARALKRDLDRAPDPKPGRLAEEPARPTPPKARRPAASTDAPVEEEVSAGGSRRPSPPQPSFIRPRRVTLKNKADHAPIVRRKTESAAPAPQRAPSPSPSAASPEPGRPEPGSIAAQVRAQVAARRAEREKLAQGGGSAAPSLDTQKPLRGDEVRGHAAAARLKSSATRRKVLDDVRKALGGASAAAEPARRPRDKVRYEAAAALVARGSTASPAPRPEPKPHVAALRARSVTGERKPVDRPVRGLAELAEGPTARAALAEATTAEDGLIVIAGPSGSGKASTLKALSALRGGRGEVLRFDEPGVAFPRGDGFRLYWGEISDAETAEAAARAAMNGALVLATLDAPSAAAAAPRLIGLGLPPYALASSLRAVLAQRIEEEICTRCAGTGRAVGGAVCGECGGEGRVERTRIAEAMVLDDATRALILSGAPEDAFQHAMTSAADRSAAAAVARGHEGNEGDMLGA